MSHSVFFFNAFFCQSLIKILQTSSTLSEHVGHYINITVKTGRYAGRDTAEFKGKARVHTSGNSIITVP